MKTLHLTWCIDWAFGYINVGNWARWRPSKFFIFELCTLYDLFLWFNQLAPIFVWIEITDFFYPLVLNFLYCYTDLLELNHLFGIYILRSEDIKGELNFFTNFKTPDFNFDELLENTDFIQKINFIIDILNQLDLAEIKEDFFSSKQPTLPFFLPVNTTYLWIFPKDDYYQKWILGSLLYKKKFPNILNLDKIFPFTISFDFFEWLVLMHIVWSFINKFIDSDIKNFLFFSVYYHFPKFYYFPDYFWKNIIRGYKLSKVLLTNSTVFWKFFVSERTYLPELEKIFNKYFLYPEDLDKWIPFLDFRITIYYIPLPFIIIYFLPNIIFTASSFFSTLFNKRRVWHKDSIYDSTIFLDLTENLPVIINVFIQMNDYSNSTVNLFFTKDNFFTAAKVLQKWIFSWMFLPSFLFSLKKQNFLFFLADNFFFFSKFWEFNLQDRYKKILKKKLGWPKKKELFYFEFEKKRFENKKKLIKLSTINSWFFFKELLKLKIRNQFLFIKLILWQLLLNIKKPF